MSRFRLLLMLLCVPVVLPGCTAVLIGGAVTAAAVGVNVANDRRDASTIVADRNLQMSVVRAINDDRALATHNHIGVAVYNRVILLVGEVADERARERAGELADGFVGARRLVNELDILPEQSFWQRRGDNALGARIKTGLLDITNIPGFDPSIVNITVAHGKVYLMGLVTQEEAAAVIDNARNTRGVDKVINLLEIIDRSSDSTTPTSGTTPDA